MFHIFTTHINKKTCQIFIFHLFICHWFGIAKRIKSIIALYLKNVSINFIILHFPMSLLIHTKKMKMIHSLIVIIIFLYLFSSEQL